MTDHPARTIATLCVEVDEAAIGANFDATPIKRGFAYANEGRVHQLDVSDGGHALSALVFGSRRDAYRVRVQIERIMHENATVMNTARPGEIARLREESLQLPSLLEIATLASQLRVKPLGEKPAAKV